MWWLFQKVTGAVEKHEVNDIVERYYTTRTAVAPYPHVQALCVLLHVLLGRVMVWFSGKYEASVAAEQSPHSAVGPNHAAIAWLCAAAAVRLVACVVMSWVWLLMAVAKMASEFDPRVNPSASLNSGGRTKLLATSRTQAFFAPPLAVHSTFATVGSASQQQ
jgi:hypothetical protein